MNLKDPVAIGSDAVQCRQALAIARAETDSLIPGHDPEILVRYPEGRIV